MPEASWIVRRTVTSTRPQAGHVTFDCRAREICQGDGALTMVLGFFPPSARSYIEIMSAVFASEMITAATSTVAAAAAARQGLATASRRSTRYIHSRSLSSFSKSHTTSRLSGTTIPRSICAQIVSKRRFVSLSLPRHEQQQAKGVPIGHVEPRLSLTFTCTVQDCGHRSTHEFSKRSYEKGIVLVQCPNCKNRYVV